MSADILDQLYKTLQDRKTADPETSYVASLYKKGAHKIAQKVGEEAAELVIEATRLAESPADEGRKAAFKNEAADLLFHVLVLLCQHGTRPQEILDILKGRMGTGGLEEKAGRKEGG